MSERELADNTQMTSVFAFLIQYFSQETLQNRTKSAEIQRGFYVESAKLLCSYPRNCSTTSAE